MKTAELVLGDDLPVPESDADVTDLVQRLRGHVSVLGVLLLPDAPGLRPAQQLASKSVPEGFMDSRWHLLSLAEATRDLVASVQADGSAFRRPLPVRRRWRGINVRR